jgi:hypothetical protein
MASDNRLQNANDIGLLSGQRSFNGFVGKKDKVDSFKLSLAQRSTCSLSLTGLKANANLTLLNASGVAIAISTQQGKRAEAITATLDAGTFYIQISQKKGNTSYVLGAIGTAVPVVTPTPLPNTNTPTPSPTPVPTPSPTPVPVINPLIYPSPEPGQSLRSAYDLGALTGVKGIQDFVGIYDPRDVYRFTLAQPSPVSAKVIGMTSSVKLQLIYDANNNGLIDDYREELETDSSRYNGASAAITRNLGAGNYFIKVLNDAEGFNTNYTLTVSPSDTPSSLPSPSNQPAYPNISPVLLSVDPGSSIGAAYNVGVLNENKVFQGFVGVTDSDDYYKITVNQSSTFSAKITGMTSDTTLQLIYDANNNGLIDDYREELESDSSRYNGVSASVSRNLGAGTYYIKVKNNQAGYNTNYILSLSA